MDIFDLEHACDIVRFDPHSRKHEIRLTTRKGIAPAAEWIAIALLIRHLANEPTTEPVQTTLPTFPSKKPRADVQDGPDPIRAKTPKAQQTTLDSFLVKPQTIPVV